jgi:cell shape-determining protein MreC
MSAKSRGTVKTNQQLKKELERMTARALRAEALVELQKKVAALLEAADHTEES